MTENEQSEEARAILEAEIERLKEHAATSVSPCDVAKLIAVRDEQVRERLHARLQNGDVPRGVRCLGPEGVLFVFACAPGRVCLVPRSFLVHVDLTAGKVRNIEDRFDPDHAGLKAFKAFLPSESLIVPHAASTVAGIARSDARVRVLSRPGGSVAPLRAVTMAPAASASGLSSDAMFVAAPSYTLTVEVAGVSYKALEFGSTRLDFFGSDRLDVTLPTAGNYVFDLIVRDFANRSFKYKVSTSGGASLEQTAETNDQGESTIRLQVTVP